MKLTVTIIWCQYQLFRITLSDVIALNLITVPLFSFKRFKIPVGVMYVRRYFNEKTRAAAIKLVGDIRSELFNILYAVSWMDAQTREKAIHKANSSRIDIGYQTGIEKGLIVLEDEYKNFELEPDQFFTNTLRLNKIAFDAQFNLLRKPINKSDSYLILSNPVQVNAFYYHIDNAIGKRKITERLKIIEWLYKTLSNC